MSTGIGGSLIIRNGNYYDYCWKEAIRSVLPICDYFVILEAYSDKDDTYECCLEIAASDSRIEVIRDKWDGDEPEGYEFYRLARLTNVCLDKIKDEGLTWACYVQGDEAWHEEGFEQLLRITSGNSRFGDEPRAIMQPFYHFVGNPHTTFPFVYSSSIRLARADSSWQADNDAWIMRPHREEDRAYVIANRAYIYHYGKLGNDVRKLWKEHDFSLLFKSAGFPDKRVLEMMETSGKIDYAYLFKDALDKGLFTPFTGTHPAVMEDWLEEHRGYFQEFA